MNNYEKIIYIKVFDFQDICKLTGNSNTAKSLIKAELEKNHIKKVKHNLYVVCNLENNNPIGHPFMIGSKVSKDSYISYRSALEFHSNSEEIYSQISISSQNKFEDFKFNNYSYKYISSQLKFGIEEINRVRVTDKERTLIDCVNKPELAGGSEFLVTSLELIGKINGEKLLKYLSYYKSRKLYAKVGFMLNWLNYVFDVEQKIIDECYVKAGSVKYYFDLETKNQNNRYIKYWNLIIPEEILSKGEEQYW
ncbi:MAG: hypothetical protein IJE68_03450 [Clostridia bacterium]|nr:hypothetical protein [Clostridia bacterium]